MDKILNQARPLISIAKKYIVTIIIVLVGSVYGFLIYTSGNLSNAEPSEASISKEYTGTKRPKVDEAIINKLNDLQDGNANFQAILDNARNNPFLE